MGNEKGDFISLTVGHDERKFNVNHNGELRIFGDATLFDDLRIPATSAKAAGVRDPGWVQFKTNGSGSTGVYAHAFDQTTEEELFFVAQMPHDWKEGSNITAHVHWSPASNGTNKHVCWGLEYTVQNINAAFGNTSIKYSATPTSGAVNLVAGTQYLSSFGEIDMTGMLISALLVCRVFRDAGGVGGTDDLAADAILFEIDFHYQRDSLGSETLYSKVSRTE